MNAHRETSGSSDKFIGKQFLSDMEAYNFYNCFARNRGFSVRRKGTDKSRKPPYEIICRKFCCNKEGLKKLCDKRQEGLTVHRRVNTRVACPAEMHIRLRFFWTKDIGLSQNLLILIHMNCQARIRYITITLTRIIVQKLAEAL